MARRPGPDDVNWQEAGIYGERPLIDEAAELRANGLVYSAIARYLSDRYGITVAPATVGSLLRRRERKQQRNGDGAPHAPAPSPSDVPPMGGNPSSGEGGNGAPAGLALSPHTTRAEGELCEISLRIPGRIEFRAWGDSPDDLRRAMGEAETILGGVTE